MSVNLLELTKSYFGPDIISKAASFVGESSPSTNDCINRIIPALMGGLMSKGSEKSGAEQIFQLVTKPEFSGGLLANVADLFSGTDTSNEAMNLGGELLKSAMGNRLNDVVNLISQSSGVKSGGASSLMKLVLPVMMSVIGKKVKNDGLGLDGFVSLLAGQREYVEEASPAGFWDGLLGVFGVGGLGAATSAAISGAADSISRGADQAGQAVDKSAKQVQETTKKVTQDVKKKAGGGFSRILPILLVIAVIGLAFYLMRQCSDNGEKNRAAEEQNMTPPANTMDDEMEETDDPALSKDVIYKYLGEDRPSGHYDEAIDRFVYDPGEIVEIGLPNDQILPVGQYSGENFLYRLITEPNYVPGDDPAMGWFTLDGVFFKTGSAQLDQSSDARLSNVAAILKAFPNVKLKFGGYTDNTGSAETNKKLSGDRAKAAMDYVIAKGIDASRLSYEGYGDQFPLCPANDTKGCRAENRRIDIRITEK